MIILRHHIETTAHRGTDCQPIARHRNPELPIQKLFISLAVALTLVCSSAGFGFADAASATPSDTSTSVPQNLGSLDDYVDDRGSSYMQSPKPSYVSGLGIAVFRREARLASGGQLGGLAVTSVDESGPAYDAGI